MNTYAILQDPGHNRVYYNLSGDLALAELRIAAQRLETPCEKIEIIHIENIRYISLSAVPPLTDKDLQIIARLSFIWAIFEMGTIKDKTCLIPIQKFNYEYLDSKISSLLKYKGKTNEIFTKMMINVALLSSNFDHSQKIELLDPVAGKGTTLFEGVVYGFNTYGIETQGKSTHEANLFFKKYLETERLKHISETRRVAGKSKADAVFIQEFEYALTKEEFKDEDSRKKLGMITGNSQDAAKYFKRNQFHLIVGDLPYGIAHGNTAGKQRDNFTRDPSELITSCLPGWHYVLKKGGTLVLAWNTRVASRQKITPLFEESGFEVLYDSPYDGFQHRVDQSIHRDIIVARKKS